MTYMDRIALQPMVQQLLVQDAAEDWTGITNSAERRKRQNRLNKRSQYKRRRQNPQNPQPAASPNHPQSGLCNSLIRSTAPPTKQSRNTTMMEFLQQACEIFNNPQMSHAVFTLASEAYQDHTLAAPRLSQLPFLTRLNINIAMAENATSMGFMRGIICSEDSISPFNYKGPPRAPISYPEGLKPTPIQQDIIHHPWLDVFPFPRFRDNVIQACAAELMDEDELCADISEMSSENIEKAGLMVWGESSNAECWEASVFLRKWGRLLKDCPEIVASTNRWRQRRGERLLF